MENIKFENPFLLLFLIPTCILGYIILVKGFVLDGYPISSFTKKTNKINIVKYLKFIAFLLSLFFLILASTTPLYLSYKIPIEEKGHSFIICLDISSTMKALDFGTQNRLDKAKEIIGNFIKNRQHDFFGIIIFAKYAIPYVPLTSDKFFVQKKLNEIEIDMIEDGTAIGNAIIMGIQQLQNYKGESKNIILLTDGINNDGYIHPIYAASEAKKYNIKIYPIAIGSTNPVSFPFKDSRGMIYNKKISIPVDYEMLKQISSISGNGENLIAKNSKDLQKIFKLIDKQKPIVTNIKTYINIKNMIIYLLIQFFTIEVQY